MGLGTIVNILPAIKQYHAPEEQLHQLLKAVAHRQVEEQYEGKKTVSLDLGPIGLIKMPYVQMGATSTVNLFDMDELIMFSFYWLNRKRYKKVADIGANIGLHTAVLSACGYFVRAYEPDPQHVKVINKSLKMNGAKKTQIINAAVSDKKGEAEFIRVMGNTTSSHLSGAKAKPYGRLEKFMVPTVAISSILKWADLIKMDIEGHERQVLEATALDDWKTTDGLVEIGTPENAKAVFKHLANLGVNMFAEKMGWQKVRKIEDMPASYKDGTLFITTKAEMPWTA